MGYYILIPIAIAILLMGFVIWLMIQSEIDNFRMRKAYLEEIARIQRKYPMGSDLDYLGRKCRIVGHYEVWPMIGCIPVLKVRYADDKGKIQYLELRSCELPAI